MTAKELLMPRFELVADFPNRADFGIKVGDILVLDYWNEPDQEYGLKKGNIVTYAPYYEHYPHLFRKLKWWEGRKEHEMPKRVVSPIYPDDVIEVVKWDMGELFGYTNLNKRQGCMLEAFKPEYEYQPID